MKVSKTSSKAPPKKANKGGFLGKVIAAVKGTPAKKPPPSKTATEPKVSAKLLPKSVTKTPSKVAPVSVKSAGKKQALPPAKGAQKSAAAPAPVPAGKKGAPKVSGAAQAKPALSARKSAAELHAESVCREVACEGLATTGVYCRMHYIKNWKKIKRKDLILREKKLNQYIEELVAKYPDKYIEAIRTDLANERDFAKVIHDLDLDEGIDEFNEEGEGSDSVIDTIKRDFEDEGEGF